MEAFKERVGEDLLRKAILQRKVAEYLVDKCVQVEQADSEEYSRRQNLDIQRKLSKECTGMGKGGEDDEIGK